MLQLALADPSLVRCLPLLAYLLSRTAQQHRLRCSRRCSTARSKSIDWRLGQYGSGPDGRSTLLQDILQDVFAFSGLTSVFVGLREAGSSFAHATGALLYTVLFLQVGPALTPCSVSHSLVVLNALHLLAVTVYILIRSCM